MDFQVNDRRGQRHEPGPEASPAPRGLLVTSEQGLNAYRRQREPWERVAQEMSRNRRIAALRKQGNFGDVGLMGAGVPAADMTYALGRPRDPMFYWRQNNLPFDITKDEEMAKLREFCRLLYFSHPILASCIDIFSKYPLQGAKVVCKDHQLQEFYEDLFFDQLDYGDYLVSLSREVWMVGEAFPLATFNETLGIWDSEELLHPNDVFVERSPISREPRFLIRLPEALREVLRTRQPVWEYNQLVEEYPELVAYAGENSRMPVSNMLLKQIKFEADVFHKRGLPIIMRAFRSVLQEEMLNTAMDAIADRLYTPLILAKLGASASDLGTEVPWIPEPADLDEFREALDAALAGDFRLMVHNFATTIESVFGREEMPDLSGDFDRLEDRILMSFGLSRTMLQGGEAGETYAADALNRDVVTELMTHHQRRLQNFFHDRARIVAEAQEHFDYDVRGGKRYVRMEEVLEVDEETGEERIVEQPKLLVPELEFDCTALDTQVLTPSGPVDAASLRPGDLVVAWDERLGAVERPVLISQTNGYQSILEITTRLGRKIKTTDNHPFLTKQGWLKAKQLTVGDALRVGTDYHPSSTTEFDWDELYFLGYMTGDSSLGHEECVFTVEPEDSALVQWMEEFVDRYNCHLVQTRPHAYRISSNAPRGVRSGIKDLLRHHGLKGTIKKDRRIPPTVWALGQCAWGAYLSGYLDADGTVSVRHARISWTAGPHGQLLRDVQCMLGLLGVRSDLGEYNSPNSRTGTVSSKWMLNVGQKESIEILRSVLSSRLSRKQCIREIDTVIRAERNRVCNADTLARIHSLESTGSTGAEISRIIGISRSVVYRALRGAYDAPVSSRVERTWDRVESIAVAEVEETWALTIAGCHTHITEGLVTHNTLNLSDEAQERQFIEALTASGVPVPQERRILGTGLDFEEMVEKKKQEQIRLAVVEQETRRETYIALRDAGLPIPDDLREDFEPRALNAPEPSDEDAVLPTLGTQDVATPALAPTEEDEQEGADEDTGAQVIPMMAPAPQEGDQRPPESDEARATMPKPAGYRSFRPGQIRQAMREHYAPPDNTIEDQRHEDGSVTPRPENYRPSGLYGPPRHVGMRRYVQIPDEDRWRCEWDEEPA